MALLAEVDEMGELELEVGERERVARGREELLVRVQMMEEEAQEVRRSQAWRAEVDVSVQGGQAGEERPSWISEVEVAFWVRLGA